MRSKKIMAGILAAYMSGMAALAPLAAQTLSGPEAQQTEQELPDVIDTDTKQVYPLTPDQKRVLNGLVIKCEQDLTKLGTPEDVAAESCQHVIDDYIRALKKAPPARDIPAKRAPTAFLS